ncbi:unnamed protein product [Linum tenue]|uniref:Uncharacterized protein n=1 Tax=Linum tenue TaxID=586396 RepID=A0AAV0MJN4_9ROSI|nr:unnamed protein product [Linum tenue]
MKKNIEAKMMQLGIGRDFAELFVGSLWERVLRANTEAGFQRRWLELQNSHWGSNNKLMDYLRGEWLPCRERWANCYTNRIFICVDAWYRLLSSSSTMSSYVLMPGIGCYRHPPPCHHMC